MDKATAKELLDFILESLALVKKRFLCIHSSDDFLQNDEGLEKLDAIAMRLQSIGEALKNLMKREKELLSRDFISHHYVAIDAEIVFDICESELDALEQNIVTLKRLI